MHAASSSEGYASGLYTDLTGRLVFYAAFEHDGGVIVAALATEGPLRTSGDLLQLYRTTLAEVGSVATLAAKLVVDADLQPVGRRKMQASMSAAAALGFVPCPTTPGVLPATLRCSRWAEFGRRAGAGLFNAWAMQVPFVLPGVDAASPSLAAVDRILARWPLAARRIASAGAFLPSDLLEASDDGLAEALVDHLFGRPPCPSWMRGNAVAFVRSLEGVLADVEVGNMVELAGLLSVDLHPAGIPDLEGFDGAAALYGEMRRHRILPSDAGPLFASFAEDWTKAPLRMPFPHGDGSERTAEDACELLLAHVAAMGRRFGVPAWLELTLPEFRELPARTADALVLAVVVALAEEGAGGMEPMADVFLRELDLKRLLWSLGIEQTRALPRSGGHIADVEGNYRDAEAAGEFAGRIAQRLRTGGSRRFGVELLEAGFGSGLDLAGIRSRIGVDAPVGNRRYAGTRTPPIVVQAAQVAPPVVGPGRMAACLAGGVALAGLVAGFGMSSRGPVERPPIAKAASADPASHAAGRPTTEWTSLAQLVDRREDLGRAVRLAPAPCPLGEAVGRVCGRFGDLTFVLTNWTSTKPAMAAYVVEGRHPVEVFSWSSTSIRQPTGIWTRHLLQALDSRGDKPSFEQEASAQAAGNGGDDR